ncbi:MAG TPA: D-2-hydroxyacid dehydrogenase [Xanthomonadales bacterium]|nr:D-2-hydroxyacid dehydrogenase [Xanthomonadales bacterium]
MFNKILIFILFVSIYSICQGDVSGPDATTQALMQELRLKESPVASRDMKGWREPKKIVIRVTNESQAAMMSEVAPGVEIIPVTSQEEALSAISGADAILGYCDEDLVQAGDNLNWIQVYSAGVEYCTGLEEVQHGSYVLTNGQHVSSPALAETSIAMMMALVRGFDLYYQNQMKGEWVRDVGDPAGTFMELTGRTMLVVGLGGIGTEVAKRAHGLGMKVVATRGSSREGPDYVDYVGLAHEVHDLASQADVVVNAAPLTDETRGMFDEAFFNLMKPTAFFISVGRGGSTVTDDLLSALENGDIAGAGLDVTDPEPLPAGHPLWSAPRIIITPHTAGRGDRGRDRLLLVVRENLRRYVAGEPMLSVVDIQRGY